MSREHQRQICSCPRQSQTLHLQDPQTQHGMGLGPGLEASETGSASQQTSQLVTTAHLRPGSRPMGGQRDVQSQPATHELVALWRPVTQFRGSVPYNVPTRRLMEKSWLTHQPMSSLQLAVSPLHSPFQLPCPHAGSWVGTTDSWSGCCIPNKACAVFNPTKIPIRRKELKKYGSSTQWNIMHLF